ncbi:TetR/AcrR family transcriptional regulator [Acinetobacter pittii]|uniref:TetR/AcrR family transcriptional regulator n=1 Tax=Acinetobacter pittii TaxID=48296 RepID=UPI0003B814DB|nr:TetR/AcrR family transcriptional regulator [Acinetobacter pittii]OIF31967.1 TetR family transcriptional regulator [Acinetobacter baumannii]AVN22380.1 TetR/AcrR family transcriptional regulator [Acinetobacter pittii]KQD36415.1 TetR family transcriptional regulator [Acinetobacter pittii]KQE60540.1 TetR family transcriptional regulator [Acinetobacter pittii]MBK0405805.1 TetR/AcrR family transcriptional regulator [Acinetobacter pittii]
MPKLVLSSRAIQVINKSIDLFHHRGFHTVGVDRIVKECEITKATFYNFFLSKARFIEICLIVQKERLKEKVVSIVEYSQDISAADKLKQLYFLHTEVEGMFYLLFKAMFETKLTYPKAYITAVRYRTWLLNEIYSQLIKLKTDATFQDAKLFLYMVEGTIIQLLSSDGAIDREKMLDCFLNANKAVNAFEYKP